jgi:hypothetical protein
MTDRSSKADLVAEPHEYCSVRSLGIQALLMNHKARTGKLNSPNSFFVAENRAITR